MKESEIESVFSKNTLLVQKQIKKDFASFELNFPLDFDTEIYSKDAIIQILEESVVSLVELGERKTLQVLYTIDISENRFLSLTQKPDFAKNLAFEILNREIQKVYYRIKYS
ncbi:MAG: hypothetical protein V4622_03180 [Bacteroidota bacterium]